MPREDPLENIESSATAIDDGLRVQSCKAMGNHAHRLRSQGSAASTSAASTKVQWQTETIAIALTADVVF